MDAQRLVIDIGNTRVKFASFVGNQQEGHVGHGWSELESLAAEKKFSSVLIASVADRETTQPALHLFPEALHYDSSLKLPIHNNYQSPQTLGVDRIANAVAAHKLASGKPALIVDAGTCLKIDFVSQFGSYEGGSISPGLSMRFKSMHAFTANLPLIEVWDAHPLIGKSTHESLVSGAVNGLTAEIFGTIQRYTNLYEDLIVFITGGDMHFFDLELKNPIFAHENLTLLGLKLILEVNE
jgi:type III pantothenate kinase